jgi:RND family efflux transporter MFP subunit
LTFRQKTKNRPVLTPRSVVMLLIALSGILVGAVHWSIDGSAEETATAADPLPVATRVLKAERDYRVARRYIGQVVARRRSALAFERQGRVVSVIVDVGEPVEPGQVLARLDTGRLDAERGRLVAERDAAAAELAEMVAGPRKEDIAQARADLARLESFHGRIVKRVARLKSVEAGRAVAEDVVDEAVFAERSALARVEAARQRLEELLAGTRPEKIAAGRARVKAGDARIAVLDVELARSVIRAPYAGTIDARLEDEGSIVGPGVPILRIVETDALEAWIGLPADAAGAFPAGRETTVVVRGRARRATVTGLLPRLEESTRTAQLVLALDANEKPLPLPGEIARLDLEQTVRARGYWVPTTALVKGRRGLWSVFLVEPPAEVAGTTPRVHRIRRAQVEVLHTGTHRVFVRGAVRNGQRIVAAGVDRVVPGQAVRPAGEGTTRQ